MRRLRPRPRLPRLRRRWPRPPHLSLPHLRQTTSAIRALHSLRPDTAHLLGRDGEVEVPVAEVMVGDKIVVKPGERFPVDGTLLEGSTQVDESMLTGEPLPVPKEAGSKLTGGSINGEGRVVLQVRAVGVDTVLSSIIRLVEDAQAAKARKKTFQTKRNR